VQRTSEGFTCPCHGAQYNSLGEVVSGPARRALPWFTLWQEADGRIWVDVSRVVDSGTSPISLSDQIEDRRAKANKNQEQS
jgi:Rieske Fe-S protein